MKQFVILLSLAASFTANAQNICVDSSSHIRYKTLPNDSLRVQKTILTKDSSKISIGFFLNGSSGSSVIYFISKTNKFGEIVWVKKITSFYFSGQSEFQNIEEASNGDIIIAGINPASLAKPFFYFIISPTGGLMYQNTFDITNAGLNLSNAYPIRVSSITRYGTDSLLLCITHPVLLTPDEPHSITLLTISNAGLPGSSYTYIQPSPTFYYPNFSKCKIEGGYIYLYGGAHFSNTCMINFIAQPTYTYLKINWLTKQVEDKKAYCSPQAGFNQFGIPVIEGGDNENIIVSELNDGAINIYRRIWGLDFNNGDTLTRLFKISEFDKEFNHLKSEYVCTNKRFRWWPDWDYRLYIDSLNTKHISVFDYPGQRIYYGIGNSQGDFYLQKQMPHTASRIDGFGTETKRLLTEPGSLTSFDIVSGDAQHTYIDNFRILAKDTAETCFGTNIDFLDSKPATVSPINWQGNFTSRLAVLETTPINFTLEDYPMERSVICNIVHKCDTIKLYAPDTVCNIVQPVIITAHKNPLCIGKVDFSFDTAQVTSYQQLNDTTISFTFNRTSAFRIYARPAACTQLIDSAIIYVSAPLNTLTLGNDTLFCPGKTYLLNAGNSYASYSWQDGSNNNTFTATRPGVYHVTAKDYCSRLFSDTIKITYRNFKINLGKDSTLCLNESMTLSVPAGYLSYNWQPQYNLIYQTPYSVLINPRINTSYRIESEVFSGCKLSDTVQINVETCPEYIYFPSGFTPNNDGLNDTFKPLTGGVFEKYELQIYNRWGQLVYLTKNKTEGWNGKYKDAMQDNGTFVWLCKYKFYSKDEKIIKGTINIIR